MTINKIETSEKEVTLALAGRLDTNTAPSLEEAIAGLGEQVTDLTLDMEGLEYISSAGLRVLLSTHKTFAGKGSLTICHVCDDIREVFDITGFSDILNIQ